MRCRLHHMAIMAGDNYFSLSKLSTDISSSTASQWIPIPPPMKRHSFLCSGVAFCNRGNQTNGTDISRPSASTTRRLSSVQLTSTARGSTSTAKVLIPFLQQRVPILFDNLLHFRQLTTTETARFHERYRVQPEFSKPFTLLDVNMRRLMPFQTEEEKSVSFNSQCYWHHNIPWQSHMTRRFYEVIARLTYYASVNLHSDFCVLTSVFFSFPAVSTARGDCPGIG